MNVQDWIYNNGIGEEKLHTTRFWHCSFQDYLATEEESDDEDGDMIELGKGFMIFKELAEKIYVHQKEGVLWMWGLHQRNKGGILADDMG